MTGTLRRLRCQPKVRDAVVVVVTGTGGMGRAVARRLGTGRALVLADASDQQLQDAAEALRADGFDVHPLSVDVASERGW